MGCFIVPATEAVITTVATKVIEKKEDKKEIDTIKLSTRLKSLNGMLWGGSALLAFEHIWHGEVQPFFPFLTAAESAEGLTEMLQEMSTVGVGMTILVTAVWAAGNFVLGRKNKKAVVKQ